jgi:glycosyltransferase involved in cell wall biosynthesis
MGSPLNILAVVPRIPYPVADGGAYYVYHTLKTLADAGHRVTTATFRSAFHPQDASGMADLGDHVTTDGDYRPYSVADALFSLVTRKPITVQSRMRPEPMDRLLTRLKSRRFDAILIEGIHAAVYIPQLRAAFPDATLIIRQSNVEYEMLARNADAARNPAIRWFYRRQSAFMKRFEAEAIRNADGITAISESDAATFRHWIPDLRCAVIAPGCHIPTVITPAAERNGSLVAISNWTWAPNHVGLSWFIDQVWPLVCARQADCRLDVVGGGLPDDVAATLRNDARIRVHGFVPDTEPFRQSASVFIAPLLSGGGVKIKVVEAMASGVPVATTSFGAEGLPVEDGVHLRIADDAEAFASHVADLLSDQSLRIRLADAASELVRTRFSWSAQAAALTEFINGMRS